MTGDYALATHGSAVHYEADLETVLREYFDIDDDAVIDDWGIHSGDLGATVLPGGHNGD